MKEIKVSTSDLSTVAAKIKAGDRGILSGTVYTAHKKIFELLDAGSPLPFSLNAAAIYYADPRLLQKVLQ